MSREELHDWIDEKLNKMGFKENISQEWGHISFQLNFENRKVVLKAVERRETEK